MIGTETVNLIGNLGFPIVAFLLVYVDLRKVIKENTKVLEKIVIHLNLKSF